MKRNFNIDQIIGDIVTINPKASEVFKKYQIDFCCGGHRPLKEAIEEQSINEKRLFEELEEAYRETKKVKEQKDFSNMTSRELIDYIVSTHHVFVRKILPEINEYTTKILKVHGIHHSELFKVHKLFSNLKAELEAHLIKEEELLFPLMKKYESEPNDVLLNKIKKVMKETESEHDGAGDILKELRIITNQYTVPEDGCASYHITFNKLQELESDLFQHIHLENNILFKRVH